ncbi:MAG: helix-turn-helix transcriptional regulator [Clostridia bacterium]|nr:helix-turn-helix transcriptional regulator [Clostridia bacterium]
MTLRELRKEKEKTVAEIATALNTTIRAVYNYENGWRRIALEHVLILSEIYNVSAETVIRAQLESANQ